MTDLLKEAERMIRSFEKGQVSPAASGYEMRRIRGLLQEALTSLNGLPDTTGRLSDLEGRLAAVSPGADTRPPIFARPPAAG